VDARDRKLIGSLHVALALLGLLPAIMLSGVLLCGSTLMEENLPLPLESLLRMVAIVLGLLAVPGLVGGLGLIAGARWAPVLVLVVSGLQLFNLPMGTAVAIFTIIRYWQSAPPGGAA
jgi:hypothetical protein